MPSATILVYQTSVTGCRRRHASRALSIHPTTVVSDEASISPAAEIGPFCVVAGKVRIGAHTVVESHVRLGGRFGEVTIGEHNRIQSGAVLGGPPQHRDYGDAPTRLAIGDGNRIGEGATVNLGSRAGGGLTTLGNRVLVMAGAHVAHDCRIGDDVVLTNLTQLAGHVEIQRNAVLGGMVAVTQHVRIGEFAFVAARSGVNKDILPYTVAEGRWATSRAVNKVGLQRAGVPAAALRNIRRAIKRLLTASLTVEDALKAIEEECEPDDWIRRLSEFAASSRRGLARA